MKRAEEKFRSFPKSEQERLLETYKAKLLAQPEWANQKPGIVQHLIGGAAKAAIIEDLMREERDGEQLAEARQKGRDASACSPIHSEHPT